MTGDLLRLPQPQLRDVRQALGELQRWRTRPAQGTALLREIARYGRADLAEQVLRTMQLARLQANLFHFNAALNAYRDWEEALAMCSRMLVLGLALDEFSLSSVTGPWPRALQLLGYKQLQPNIVRYNAAISALRSLWVAAAELLTCLQRSAQRDDFSVSALVASYGEGGQWQRGQLLLGGGGVPYNAAISACDLADQWQMSLQLLLTACLLRLPPQAARVGAAAAATGAASAWRSAWRLWEEMQMLQLKANEIVCGSALRACGSRGLWAETLALRSAAKAQQVSNAICESMVTLACEQASLWRCALATLPSEPPMDATAMAIGACGSLRKWALALFLRAGDSESGTRAALGSCASAGRWELALQLCGGGATEPGDGWGQLLLSAREPSGLECTEDFAQWRRAGDGLWPSNCCGACRAGASPPARCPTPLRWMHVTQSARGLLPSTCRSYDRRIKARWWQRARGGFLGEWKIERVRAYDAKEWAERFGGQAMDVCPTSSEKTSASVLFFETLDA
ncbi:unnamed protein product [Effrenium voratum]|nr:unnamed protein product [Effrenium voratum]